MIPILEYEMFLSHPIDETPFLTNTSIIKIKLLFVKPLTCRHPVNPVFVSPLIMVYYSKLFPSWSNKSTAPAPSPIVVVSWPRVKHMWATRQFTNHRGRWIIYFGESFSVSINIICFFCPILGWIFLNKMQCII